MGTGLLRLRYRPGPLSRPRLSRSIRVLLIFHHLRRLEVRNIRDTRRRAPGVPNTSRMAGTTDRTPLRTSRRLGAANRSPVLLGTGALMLLPVLNNIPAHRPRAPLNTAAMTQLAPTANMPPHHLRTRRQFISRITRLLPLLQFRHNIAATISSQLRDSMVNINPISRLLTSLPPTNPPHISLPRTSLPHTTSPLAVVCARRKVTRYRKPSSLPLTKSSLR